MRTNGSVLRIHKQNYCATVQTPFAHTFPQLSRSLFLSTLSIVSSYLFILSLSLFFVRYRTHSLASLLHTFTTLTYILNTHLHTHSHIIVKPSYTNILFTNILSHTQKKQFCFSHSLSNSLSYTYMFYFSHTKTLPSPSRILLYMQI